MKRKTKIFLRRVRIPIEWIGIGLGLLIITPLPRRLMLALCDFVSAIMYLFDGKGKALSRKNLSIVLGSQASPRVENLIIRRSYRNMARSVGYAFWTCINAKSRCRASGEMCARGKAFLAANKPAVTVSGHIGCWEILSQLAFLEGHAMMSVAKDIGTDGMTRLLMRARRSIGQEIVPANGAFRPLMAGLKSGKSLGLLVDQVVKPQNGGVWVRFFGRPVPVSAAPAFFAAKCKVPIVIAWSRPRHDGRWCCEVLDIFDASTAKDVWGFTQKSIHLLEKTIRRHPSCWVLNYRYFRKTPTAEELSQLDARAKKHMEVKE